MVGEGEDHGCSNYVTLEVELVAMEDPESWDDGEVGETRETELGELEAQSSGRLHNLMSKIGSFFKKKFFKYVNPLWRGETSGSALPANSR